VTSWGGRAAIAEVVGCGKKVLRLCDKAVRVVRTEDVCNSRECGQNEQRASGKPQRVFSKGKGGARQREGGSRDGAWWSAAMSE